MMSRLSARSAPCARGKAKVSMLQQSNSGIQVLGLMEAIMFTSPELICAQSFVTFIWASLFRRYKFLRKFGTRAEKVLFHLLHQKLLGLRLPGLQAVFVEQHLGVLGPHAPCVGAYVLVDFLSQRSIKGGLGQSGQFSPQLHALHQTRHFLQSPFFILILQRYVRLPGIATTVSDAAFGRATAFLPGWQTGSCAECDRYGPPAPAPCLQWNRFFC